MKDLAFEFNASNDLIELYLIDREQLKKNFEEKIDTPCIHIFTWKYLVKESECFKVKNTWVRWYCANSTRYYSEDLTKEQKINSILGIFS